MSIGIKALKYIEEILEVDKRDIKDLTICCMGHLNTKRCSRDYMRSKKIDGYTLLSSYFKYLGAEVIEIDLDTKGIALPIDLGREIKDETLFSKFDFIIDGGTGEHIDNQYEYFNNVYNLLKVGGIAIHMLPYIGSWDMHARWLYDIEWVINFVKTHHYQIVDIRKTNDTYQEYNQSRILIFFSIKKVDTTKIDKAKFINPYFDPQGDIKNNMMYNRFVLPARSK